MRFSKLLTAITIGFAFTTLQADDQANFCKLTARNALHSCKKGADGDYWLALGKCDNLGERAKRDHCRHEAFADLNDAREECNRQDAVRAGACTKLGPEPFDPVINPANFVEQVDNPYFPLVPGTNFVYEGMTSEGLEHDEFYVTRKTKKILGVTTTEVHDVVTVNGRVTEDTLDWFAQDKEGNVWYFGENTEELVDGRPSTLEGTFTAGKDGAKPGIIMEAHPKIGDFYRQEFDLGNAEDYAAVSSLNETVTVPVGKFEHCLKTPETTPLEPDLHEAKWYAPGVGNVLEQDLVTGKKSKLIRIEHK